MSKALTVVSVPLVTVADALHPTCQHPDCKGVSALTCSDCDRPLCVIHARSSIWDAKHKQCDACYECSLRNTIWWRKIGLTFFSLALFALIAWECVYHLDHHHLEGHGHNVWTVDRGHLRSCPAPFWSVVIVTFWLAVYFQPLSRKNWRDTPAVTAPTRTKTD